ncbi:MAG: cadherin-like domain-containing protein, partial [Planctomycetaceae bacterium]|nr:cadherin-like domain-containing protein [Planctomycetaceae bacterium]
QTVFAGGVFLNGSELHVHGTDGADWLDLDNDGTLDVTMGAFSYSYSSATVTAIRARMHDGDDTITTSSTVGSPMWAFGGDGDDTIHGTSLGDKIHGGDGDDTLYGGDDDDGYGGDGGADVIYGDAGNDVIYGQSQGDTLYGDAGSDTLYGDDATPGVLDGADVLHGGADNDTLFGGSLNDTLFGDTGNDALDGQDGIDVLHGGDGLDSPEILDDAETGYQETGVWADDAAGGGFGGNQRLDEAGSGAEKAAWTFSNLSSGDYEVHVTWDDPDDYGGASNAPFAVFDGATSRGSFSVNQRVYPSGSTVADASWLKLGTSFSITSGTLKVELTDNADGTVRADAVRIVQVGAPANQPPTLDAIPDPAAIDEDSPMQTVNLFGITAGAGESQNLTVTATSDNTGLIPDPTVIYTLPNSTGSLQYAPIADQSGTAAITVTVTDAGLDGVPGNGDDGIFFRTFAVTVSSANDIPVVAAGPDDSIDEGGTFTSSGSFTDPDTDSWMATVDYGDGTGPQTLTLNPDKTFSLSHTYVDNGNYTVTVTVDDAAGVQGSDTLVVTVANVAPTLVSSGDSTVDINATYTLSLSSADPGDDTIQNWEINWGDSDPEPVTGNPPSLTHTYTTPGYYTISATATDEDGTYSAPPLSVAVNYTVNSPPFFVSTPPLETVADLPFEYQAVAVDPDPGDELTYHLDAGSIALGLLIDSVNGEITWTPTQSDGGLHVITTRVEDDHGGIAYQTFPLTVLTVNTPPTADAGGPYFASEGGTIQLDGSGSWDPNQTYDTLQYEWDLDGDGNFGETGPGFAPNGDEIGMTPLFVAHDDVLGHTISLRVTDSDLGSHTDTAAITISNVAPTLTIGGNTSVDEDAAYTLTLSSSDPGDDTIESWFIDWGDTQTETVSGNPASVTHEYAVPGPYTIQATATDEDGTYSANSHGVTVNNVNDAPYVANLIDDMSVDVGTGQTIVDLSQTFGDDDLPYGNSLTLSITSNDNTVLVAALINGSSLILDYLAGQVGTATIVVRATDNAAAFVEDTFTVTVVNQSPVTTDDAYPTDGVNPVVIGAGSGVLANDSDPNTGDTLTAHLVSGPSEGSLTLNTDGSFAYTPNAGFIGPDSFVYEASDPHNAATLATVTLVLNQPPAADAGGPYTIEETLSLTLNASGSSDPEGTTLTYEWDFDGDGIFGEIGTAFGDETGIGPSFLAGDGQATYYVTLRVTDAVGFSGTDTARIDVVNLPPVVSDLTDLTIVVGATLHVGGSFVDLCSVDTWTATVDYDDGAGPQTLILNQDKTFILEHVYTSDDVYTVTVVVTDDDGGTGEMTFDVTVVPNTAPTANAGGPYLVDEGGAVVLDGSLSGDPEQPSATLLYEWDLDGDGQFGEAGETGVSPTFSAVGLTAPATITVYLRVTDHGMLTDTAETTIDVAELLYWDPDGISANNDLDTGAGLGGSGQWMSAGCWYDPATGARATWDNAAGQTAVFAGTAGTATLASAASVDRIEFLTAGYSISGGSITLTGPKLTAADGTSTIVSPLAGSVGLTKLGDGTLVLSGSNTYAGGTIVSDGTLQIGAGGTKGTLGSGAVSGSSSGTLTFDRSNNLTVANAVLGDIGIEKSGTGTLALTGTNTYSGTTTISEGMLQIGGGATTGTLGTGDVLNNAALRFCRSN